VDAVELASSLERVGGEFGIKVLTADEAIAWIRSNTDLAEEEPGKFLVAPAYVDLIGNEIPAKYLVI